jgi:hypothetical protein
MDHKKRTGDLKLGCSLCSSDAKRPVVWGKRFVPEKKATRKIIAFHKLYICPQQTVYTK